MADASAPFSGLFAMAKIGTTVQHLAKWSVNPKAEASEVHHSATNQGTDRVPGNDDWDGSYTAYLDNPLVWPGQYFTFYGAWNEARTQGVTGRAICDEITLKIDVEGGKEIVQEVKFSGAYDPSTGTGELTEWVGAALTLDTNYTALRSGTSCKAALCVPGSDSYTDILDVRSIDISFKAANKPYNSSRTAGHTARVKGPLDVTLSIGVYCQDFNNTTSTQSGYQNLPDNQQVNGVKIYTDGLSVTRCWDINYIIFGQKTGIDVDRAGNVVGCTLNAGLKSLVTYGGVDYQGYILDPDNLVTTRWGTLPV
jgi:hypothetical protein